MGTGIVIVSSTIGEIFFQTSSMFYSAAAVFLLSAAAFFCSSIELELPPYRV